MCPNSTRKVAVGSVLVESYHAAAHLVDNCHILTLCGISTLRAGSSALFWVWPLTLRVSTCDLGSWLGFTPHTNDSSRVTWWWTAQSPLSPVLTNMDFEENVLDSSKLKLDFGTEVDDIFVL